MLIARSWSFTRLIGRLDPVPAAITVSAQAPCICKTRLIRCTSTEADHHTCGRTSLTKSSRMIDSCRWHLFACVEFVPRERSTFNTQTPNVIYWLLACIASEHKQMWLRKDNCVAVPATRSRSYNRYDHPLCHFLAIAHIEQIKIIARE